MLRSGSHEPTTTSTKAILSLVFAFFCVPVGLVLGILALSDLKKNPTLGGRGLAIAGIVISSLGLIACIPGVLAAIAIPNFIKFQARAKQSECKQQLKQLYTLEETRAANHAPYATTFAELGMSWPGNQRYAYFLDESGEAGTVSEPEEKLGGPIEALRAAVSESGATPSVSEDAFTFVCAGNIDRDGTIDVWSISSESQPGAPAGMPVHVVDDLER